MADIILTCKNCGNTITVSEFVSAEFITCRKCNEQVPVPVKTPEATPAAPKLRIAVEAPPPPPPEPVAQDKKKNRRGIKAAQSNDVRKYLPQAKKRMRVRRVTYFEAKVLPWLLFFVLGAILCWLRFWPDAVAPDTLKTVISGGVWVLLIMHITVICYAFTDDVFYGILCFLIPGYTVYYLYIQSDQMIMRSVMGALLIAFGWDAAIAIKDLWAEVYSTVSIWIATTDTIKK
jgi:hypothetical protein